jgi:hypothetical protein
MRGTEGYYYPNTLRKMIQAALGMFNEIVCYKYDKQGNIIDDVEVPVSFGPRKRVHEARTNEEQTQRTVPVFPRIELTFKGHNLDESRIASPNTQRFWNVENLDYKVKDHNDILLTELNGSFSDFNPLPFNYEFSINIFTESIDHYSQIVEQIFPYFAPANSTLRVREFDFLNIARDINVVLGSPAVTFAQDEMTATDRRDITADFSLSMQGWMYRKVRKSSIVNNMAFTLDEKLEEKELVEEQNANDEPLESEI